MNIENSKHHVAISVLSALEATIEQMLIKVAEILNVCDWVDSSIFTLIEQINTINKRIELNVSICDPGLSFELLRLKKEIINTTSSLGVEMNALLGRTEILLGGVRKNILSVKKIGQVSPAIADKCENLNRYLAEINVLCSVIYAKIENQISDLSSIRSN